MNVTLIGNNFHQLKGRLDNLVKEYTDKYGDLGVEKIEGENADHRALLEALSGSSLLAQNRLFIIRDLSQNKTIADNVEQIISSVDEATQIIFVEPLIDKRSSYFKVLNRLTQLEEYNDLDASELTTWLVGEAKKQGAELAFSDAKYLVERAGENQGLLASELDKLITYDRQVSRQNIDSLVAENPQTKVFDLLDAAFSGNKKRALKLYEEQRSQKVEPPEIMAMVAWQLRLIALAKLGRAKTSSQIASDTAMSSYPITKAQALGAQITDVKLKKLVAEAARLDKLTKSSPVDADEALRTYITTL